MNDRRNHTPEETRDLLGTLGEEIRAFLALLPAPIEGIQDDRLIASAERMRDAVRLLDQQKADIPAGALALSEQSIWHYICAAHLLFSHNRFGEDTAHASAHFSILMGFEEIRRATEDLTGVRPVSEG